MGRRKKNGVNFNKLPPGCKKLVILLTRLTEEDIARYTSSNDQNKQPVTNSWNETQIKQELDVNEPSASYKDEYTTSTWQHIQNNFKIEPIDLNIIKTEPLNTYGDNVNPTYPNYHGTFDCSMCYEVFDNYEEFIIHKNLTHKLNQLYECLICNEKFGLSAHLNSHLLIHVDYLRLQNTALHSIKTRSSSNDHSSMSKEKKFNKCSGCNFITNSELKLLRHQNICKKNTRDDNLHNCKLCSRSFFNQTALNGHLRYHSLRGDIISKRTLKKNRKHKLMGDSVNNSSKKHKMTCQLCDQIFVNKKWLDKHIMKRHENVQIINGKYFVPQKTMTNILALRNQ